MQCRFLLLISITHTRTQLSGCTGSTNSHNLGADIMYLIPATATYIWWLEQGDYRTFLRFCHLLFSLEVPMVVMMAAKVEIQVGDTMDHITANLTRRRTDVMFAVTWRKPPLLHPTTFKGGLPSMAGTSTFQHPRRRR